MIHWWLVIPFLVVGWATGWSLRGLMYERRQWHQEERRWWEESDDSD